MKIITEHLAQIIAIIAAISLLITSIVFFKGPVSLFFENIIEKETSIGDKVFENLENVGMFDGEGGSEGAGGAGETGGEDNNEATSFTFVFGQTKPLGEGIVFDDGYNSPMTIYRVSDLSPSAAQLQGATFTATAPDGSILEKYILTILDDSISIITDDACSIDFLLICEKDDVDLSDSMGFACKLPYKGVYIPDEFFNIPESDESYGISITIDWTPLTNDYIPGLYETGAIDLYYEQGADAIEDMLVMSWEELVDYGYMTVTDGALYHTNTTEAISTYASMATCELAGDLLLPQDRGITAIDDCAFSHSCFGLTGIILPERVTMLGEDAFQACDGLVSITLPNNISVISTSAFDGCSSLINVTLPDNVVSIDKRAFAYCDNLAHITIPASVTSFGYGAFLNSVNLTSITFEGTVEQWDNIYKSTDWNWHVPATKVVCSDGEVSLGK